MLGLIGLLEWVHYGASNTCSAVLIPHSAPTIPHTCAGISSQRAREELRPQQTAAQNGRGGAPATAAAAVEAATVAV
eukprot:scaffold163471_cov21-Tisochrysis_lutea.AAC.5